MKKLMLLCSFMIICANLSFAGRFEQAAKDSILLTDNSKLIEEARDIVNPPPPPLPPLENTINDLKLQVDKYKELDELDMPMVWGDRYTERWIKSKKKEYRNNIANLLTVIDGRAGNK